MSVSFSLSSFLYCRNIVKSCVVDCVIGIEDFDSVAIYDLSYSCNNVDSTPSSGFTAKNEFVCSLPFEL